MEAKFLDDSQNIVEGVGVVALQGPALHGGSEYIQEYFDAEFAAMTGAASDSFVGPQPVEFAAPDDSDLLSFDNVDEVNRVDIDLDAALEAAVNKPDDKVALKSISEQLSIVVESGNLNKVMELAMTLGAMACIHPHLEGVAKEASDALDGLKGTDDGHNHNAESEEVSHDTNSCEKCKAGKRCPNRK